MSDTKVFQRVIFLLNNFTSEKIQMTGDELAQIVTEAYYMWFAFHMVRDRAANEMQFHDAYIQLLLHMKSKLLMQTVMDVASEGVLCMSCLCSEGTNLKENSEIRKMLKPLGDFIGKLTLNRNVPILKRDLDVQMLLVDAFKYGRLIAVFPVVAAIMTQARDSPVFGSLLNPWTKSIFGLLKEIYCLKNLKIMLTFAFEALCKHYNVSAEDIQRTQLLQGIERQAEHARDFKAPAGEGDSSAGDRMHHSESAPGETGLPHVSSATVPGMMGKAQSIAAPGGDTSEHIALSHPPPPPPTSLNQLVKIPHELQQYAEQLQLTALTATCLERAVADIMNAAAERTVSIACKATSHIVLKDFVHDPSERSLHNAGRNMVAALAGSLSVVTCREALLTSLVLHLQQALKSIISPHLVDEVAGMLGRANHSIGCEYIERIAAERSLKDIEEYLAPVRLLFLRTQDLHVICSCC
jgi:CCR4-NOT transcription complex subunit 1